MWSRTDPSLLFLFPEIPLVSPGLEAEHVTLCWGVGRGLHIYMLLFTVTVTEEGSCTTREELRDGVRGGKRRRAEGKTFQ